MCESRNSELKEFLKPWHSISWGVLFSDMSLEEIENRFIFFIIDPVFSEPLCQLLQHLTHGLLQTMNHITFEGVNAQQSICHMSDCRSD